MIAPGDIQRLQNEDVGRVLHHAIRIRWRKFQIGDDRIARIAWVDLTVRTAAELHVLARGPKLAPAERRRLHPRNFEPRNTARWTERLRRRGRGGQARRDDQKKAQDSSGHDPNLPTRLTAVSSKYPALQRRVKAEQLAAKRRSRAAAGESR